MKPFGALLSFEEAKKVVEAVSSKLDVNANIIWGAQLSPDLQNTIRAMLVVTGVTSPQIFGPKKTFSSKKKEDLEKDLGIEFVD